VDIDLYSPEVYGRGAPHEQFKWLRENEPVFWHPIVDQPLPGDPQTGPGFWCLTRYKDIEHASKDFRHYSSAGGTNIVDPVSGVELMMINTDPPYHTKLRSIVSKGFHPKAVALIEEHIRDIVTNILDRVATKGECDFVTEIAAELPLEVIAEFMGVPVEDRHKIFEWTNTMIAQGADPEYSPNLEDATRAFIAISEYANTLADLRKDDPQADLISKIIHTEVDGEYLNTLEYDMFFVMLAVAGNETTRNLISGGMFALIENPEQREILLANPSKMPLAVEEMLRWVTPVMHFRRTATEDFEIGGKTIKRGDKILLWYLSGNRDEEVFEDPYAFNVLRDPNPHMTFGAGGPHFCLGFSLAQLEIRVMFEELLRRFPDMELTGPIQRLHSNFIRGIRHMPVKFTPEHV